MSFGRKGSVLLVPAAVDLNAKNGKFYRPVVMFAGPSKRKTPSKRARNGADTRALREKPEELAGVVFDA